MNAQHPGTTASPHRQRHRPPSFSKMVVAFALLLAVTVGTIAAPGSAGRAAPGSGTHALSVLGQDATPATGGKISNPLNVTLPPLIEQWMLAQINEDPGAYDAVFADESSFEDTGRQLIGRGNDMAKLGRFFFAEVSNLVFEPRSVLQGEGFYVLDTRVMYTDEATGKPVDYRMAAIFRHDGEKIVKLTLFYDYGLALYQTGRLVEGTPAP